MQRLTREPLCGWNAAFNPLPRSQLHRASRQANQGSAVKVRATGRSGARRGHDQHGGLPQLRSETAQRPAQPPMRRRARNSSQISSSQPGSSRIDTRIPGIASITQAMPATNSRHR